MKAMQYFPTPMRRLALLLAVVLALAGCKELSNDPPEKYGNLVVSLKDIQAQMGIKAAQKSNTRGSERQQSVSVPTATEATDAVASLLVGAFVVTSRETPYTADVAITSEIEDNLKEELSGSIDYITIVDLPTEKDYIEFPYPKSTLSKWQVIAVGLNFAIKEFGELAEDEHKDSILYAGFSDRFYQADTIGENEVVDVPMFRACLTNPVKGCATYTDILTDDPVVTSAVEILGVRYNDAASDFAASGVSFPIIVRNETQATAAKEKLKSIITQIRAAGVTINSLTVRSTHTMNTAYESAACQAYKNSEGVTVAQLEAVCEVNLAKITIAQ